MTSPSGADTRVEAGELTNAEAAAELGINPAAWSSWKAYPAKRASRIRPGGAPRSALAVR
ncbi:MAG: hypothetical protein IPN34_17030 [Planctomycetes bacterium]|nr:hypothetical protein [Planctomycetota bacterium]